MSAHVRRRSVYADRLLEFPEIVFSDGRELSKRGRWREHFGLDRLIFEIGCNDAALLAAVAAKYPSVGFVGIDWKCRALHSAATRVNAAGLRNVALLHGRAQEVRRIFADGEVDEAWFFHPDPCDKPRELPNRLLAEPFLLDLHQALSGEESVVVLKTDHQEYYDWVRGEIDRSAVAERFEVAATSNDYWNDPAIRARTSARCFATERTLFEQRFISKRKPILYLELKKRSSREARRA